MEDHCLLHFEQTKIYVKISSGGPGLHTLIGCVKRFTICQCCICEVDWAKLEYQTIKFYYVCTFQRSHRGKKKAANWFYP